MNARPSISRLPRLTRRFARAVPAGVALLVGLAVPAQTAGASPDRAGGNAECRNGYVALTYDDGPTATTPDLLAALRSAGLRATFFDVGQRAEQFPAYVRAERALGHAVANHSYDHADLVALGEPGAYNQLAKTQDILTGLTGSAPRFFRPPYGSTSDQVRADAAQLGMTEVIWTVDTVDWSGPSTDDIVDAALTVKPGGVILMHDGYRNTVNAVRQIAKGLSRAGLCAGRLVQSDTPTKAWDDMYFAATVAPW
jgi:peptidoglycan/xylan/chitin deacetylase (PgdA/CDA1 family)